jgi:HSP20 family protein
MAGWPTVLLSAELGDLAEDVRRLFQELGSPAGGRGAAGDCVPPVDVLETDEAFEVLMDLPGVPAASIRILLKGSVLIIAGEKWVAGPAAGAGGYHLVERASGRFARVVRLNTPIDGSKARARLTGGELRVTLPRLPERRGRGLEIPVEVPSTP